MLGKTHKAFSGTMAATLVTMPLLTTQTDNILPRFISETGLSPLLATLFESSVIYVIQSAIIVYLSYKFGSLPDWDNVFKNIKHRPEFSHSIYPIILLTWIYYLTQDTVFYLITLPLLIGYGSHLIGDAYGVRGIDWFLLNGTQIYYNNNSEVTAHNGEVTTRNGEVTAQIVKGNRVLFPKLYRTGDKFLKFIPAHKIWNLILFSVIIIYCYLLFIQLS